MPKASVPASLFNRVGGPNGVRDIVDELDKLVTNDSEMMEMFEGIRFSLIKVHNLMFLRMAFEGMGESTEDSLLWSHKRLFLEKGLNGEHLDALTRHLVTALNNASVKQEMVEEAVSNLSQMREIFENGVYKCEYIEGPPAPSVAKPTVRREPRPEQDNSTPLTPSRRRRRASLTGALKHMFAPNAA